MLDNFKSESFGNVINHVIKVYNLVNGKINSTMCKAICINFEGEKIAFIDNQKVFYFNVTTFSILNDYFKTAILDIVTHELSHLEQEVDYDRYRSDKEYYTYIEQTNIDRVYDFIMSNRKIIESSLNFKIDMNYMNLIKNCLK